MREWKKLTDYYEQQEKDKEISERFEVKITEARNKITEGTAKLELLLRREATSGVDMSEDKRKARKAVADAESMLGVAQEEATKVRMYIREENEKNSDRIALLDLVYDWQRNFLPKLIEEERDPIAKAVAESREAYLNAMVDYRELEEKIERKYADIHDILRNVRNENGNYCFTPGAGFELSRDLQRIHEGDLRAVNHGYLPQNVKRIKHKDKQENKDNENGGE